MMVFRVGILRVTLAAVCALAAGGPLPTYECDGAPGTAVTIELPAGAASNFLSADAQASLLASLSRALMFEAPSEIAQCSASGDGECMEASLARSARLLLRPASKPGGGQSLVVIACGFGHMPNEALGENVAVVAQIALGGEALSWSVVPAALDVAELGGVSVHSEDWSLVARHSSQYAKAEIWRIGDGLRLFLDDIVMSDTRDEAAYHEMLVHPALLAVVAPRLNVLVIGGGEGAVLREVLKHPRVESATMVEIDAGLVDLAREHLAPMHQGSFDEPRVRLVFDDGASFLRRSAPDLFDAIIVDGVDFYGGHGDGHGNALFAATFYAEAYRALRPGGIFAQYASGVEERIRRELQIVGFGPLVSLGVDVPSFYGGGARFAVAAKAKVVNPCQGDSAARHPLSEDRLVNTVASAADGLSWRYLTSERLREAFAHKARQLKGSSGGSGGGGDGEANPVMVGIMISLTTLLFGGWGVRSAYKKGFFDDWLDPLRPEEDEHNRSGADPLKVRGVEVPRKDVRTFLQNIHSEYIANIEGTDCQAGLEYQYFKALEWEETRFRHGLDPSEFEPLCQRLGFDHNEFGQQDEFGQQQSDEFGQQSDTCMPTVVGMPMSGPMAFPPAVAPAAGGDMMQVTVPEGMKPGMSMNIDLGGGQVVSAVIPDGHEAGQSFYIQKPAAPAAMPVVVATAVPVEAGGAPS